MIKYADRVRQTTTTTGTGTLSLDGTITGWIEFVDGIGDAAKCYYTLQSSSGDWENGIGTVTDAATDTLSRDTVLSNNSGTTALITLPAGTHNVFLCPAAAFWTIADEAQRNHLAGGRVKYDATQGYIIEAGTAVIADDYWSWSATNGGGPSGYTANSIYFVYAYDNAGTVAFEAVTTVPVRDDNGYWTKTAATTRRLLGAFLTGSGGAIIPFQAFRELKTLSLFWQDAYANCSIFSSSSAATWTQLTSLTNYVPVSALAWFADIEQSFTADADAQRIGLNPAEISGGDIEDGIYRRRATAAVASDKFETSLIRLRCDEDAPDAWVILDNITGTPTCKIVVSGVEIAL